MEAMLAFYLSLQSANVSIHIKSSFLVREIRIIILNYAAKSATQTSSLYAKQSSNYFMGRKYY